MKVEICTPSIQSAINAKRANVDRIELCQNLSEGGTTPSFAAIQYCVDVLQIPTNVLIRPRSGDFCYSDAEFDLILRDIDACKSLGVNGIVVGMLNSDLSIDVDKMTQIMKMKGSLEVTFHRAFDLCKEKESGVSILKKLGINRILTSGFEPTAYQGMKNLAKLVKIAQDDIIILAASGINAENAPEIILQTGVQEIHASCSERVINNNVKSVPKMGKSNIEWGESSYSKICQLLTAVK